MRAVIFVLFFTCSLAALPQCQKDMLGMIFDAKDIGTFITTYVNSGHGLNQLGNMGICNNTPGKKFVRLEFGASELDFGLCGPASCSVSDYETLKPTLVSLSAKAGGKFQLLMENATFSSPATEANFSGIPAGGWVMISFLIVMFLLCVAGAVTEYLMIQNFKTKAKFRFSTYVSAMEAQNGYLEIEEQTPVNSDTTEEEWQRIESNFSNEYMLRCMRVYNNMYPYQRFLLHFSLLSNGYSLTSSRPNEDKALSIFNGIRVLSICWVMAGHCFSTTTTGSLVNLEYTKSLINNYPFLMISNGSFSVDTFFFLSGLLAAYVITKKLACVCVRTAAQSVPLAYLHRYLRLTPVMLVVIMVSWKVVPYLGDGQLWNGTTDIYLSNHACGDNWWRNILYINNLNGRHGSNDCLPQLWYTGADMQMFLLVPLMVMLYVTVHKLVAVFAIVAVCVASWVHIWVLSVNNDYGAFLVQPDSQQFDYYVSPLCRVSVYMIGMLIGFAYYEHKVNGRFSGFTDAVKKNARLRWVFYLAGFGLMQFIVFCVWPLAHDYGSQWGKQTTAAYLAFSRPGFVIALSMIMLPAVLGKGSFLRALLDNYLMGILSRLSYALYLVHVTVLIIFWSALDYGWTVSYLNNFYLALGLILTSTLIATLLYLFVEMPFARLERAYLAPKPKQKAISSQEDLFLLNLQPGMLE